VRAGLADSLLRIPDELLDLRAAFRDFLAREVRPIEDAHRQELQEGRLDKLKQEVPGIRRRSAELGFWAAHMPEEVGGGGLSCLGQVLLHEEAHRQGSMLARWEAFLPGVTGPSRVYLACDESQRSRYLAPLMSAAKAACFALTESGAGSDAASIATRADRAPDGWVISGRKQFITAATEADFALVFAVTDPGKGIRGGISAFFVEASSPGFEIARVQPTISPWQAPAELVLDGVAVGDEHVLGEVGFGLRAALVDIDTNRLNIAAAALGIADHLLQASIEYAKARITFGRPIASYQYVQGQLVDSHAALEQARLLVYACAAATDAGIEPRGNAALAKLVATEAAQGIADRAIQVHGGAGVLTEVGVESWYRELRAMRVYEGTSEILRVNIAKALGLP
jgi:acyl-CoA dehydrogenase